MLVSIFAMCYKRAELFKGALTGALARFLPRRARPQAPESSDEELPEEYSHLPIYYADKLPKTAVRSGTGTQFTYHDREGRDVVSESAPTSKRKRAQSSRRSVPNVEVRPPLKRIRRHISESSSEPTEDHKPVLASHSHLSDPQTWDPWPDGSWEATFSREYLEECQFAVHWACEVRGGKKNTVGSLRAEEKYDVHQPVLRRYHTPSNKECGTKESTPCGVHMWRVS
ncbi:hypothetical protein B0H12DRAFT_1079932 [Mycena haematopus]|nr:hypothetical protein B0H12DRAFT_1079932 [Mycena haematopus]